LKTAYLPGAPSSAHEDALDAWIVELALVVHVQRLGTPPMTFAVTVGRVSTARLLGMCGNHG
jgi:hypothetical protein